MKGIWTYSHLLPPIAEKHQLSLGEGNTPLVKSRRIGPELGLDNLYFKLEITNPSGSYKDRFAALAISDMLQHNNKFCLATSSGNTGSALAAYCAVAAIRCFLAIVDGAPSGKLRQMRVYGASTIMIKDFGLDERVTAQIFSGLKATADKYGSQVQISAFHYSPVGMAGVQTIAYEIAEALPHQNMHVFCQAGGGGLTLAVARGFSIWKKRYPGSGSVRVHCVQPEGNNTIAGALRGGKDKAISRAHSTTTISGLQVPGVIDGDEVISICRQSGGNGYVVKDAAIYRCQADLAGKEGLFCEPAGATALAGLKRAVALGEVDRKEPVVCLITGHGFKDPVSAETIAAQSKDQYFNSAEETFRYMESEIKTI